jgi:hypothetical protein
MHQAPAKRSGGARDRGVDDPRERLDSAAVDVQESRGAGIAIATVAGF